MDKLFKKYQYAKCLEFKEVINSIKNIEKATREKEKTI